MLSADIEINWLASRTKGWVTYVYWKELSHINLLLSLLSSCNSNLSYEVYCELLELFAFKVETPEGYIIEAMLNWDGMFIVEAAPCADYDYNKRLWKKIILYTSKNSRWVFPSEPNVGIKQILTAIFVLGSGEFIIDVFEIDEP